MPYGDELIIAQRLAKQKEKANSISNRVNIGGIEYQFARRSFELGFTMIVPESFEAMPDTIAKRKFPNEGRPSIIISSADFRVCLAYNYDDSSNESLDDRLHSYRNFMKRLHATNVFFSEIISEASCGLNIACYDYRYAVIDSDIYNISFFTDLPDKELLGWFICPIDVRSAWEPLARQMIKSIDVAKEEQNA